MDTQNLQLLIDVARRGNFAEVARDRKVDPSRVSRIVAGIEEELGFRIFQRSTRRLTLTEAGNIYVTGLTGALDDIDRAREEAAAVSAGPKGTLRLTASVAFGHRMLLPILPLFTDKHPGVDVDLILTDENIDLVGQRVDLALRLAANLSGEMVASRLMSTRYRVCASPSWLKQHERIFDDPTWIQNTDCLLLPLPGFRTRWIFRDRSGSMREVKVRGNITASSALALHNLAVAGQGPALLADWLAGPELREGTLIDLFPDHDVTATTFDTAVWMLYSSRAHVPFKVRSFIDHLRNHLGHAPPPYDQQRLMPS